MGRCGSHLPRSLWGEGGRGSGCLTLAGLPGESSSAIPETESFETASVLAGLTLVLPWALQVREAQKQDRHTERPPGGGAQPPWGPAPSGGAVPLGLCGSSHAGLVLLSAERGDDLGERMPSPKVRTASPFLGTLRFPSEAAPGLPPRSRERLYLEWLAYLLAPGAVHWSGRLGGVRGAFRLCCPSAPRSTSRRSLRPPGRAGCLPAQLARMIPSRHVQALRRVLSFGRVYRSRLLSAPSSPCARTAKVSCTAQLCTVQPAGGPGEPTWVQIWEYQQHWVPQGKLRYGGCP